MSFRSIVKSHRRADRQHQINLIRYPADFHNRGAGAIDTTCQCRKLSQQIGHFAADERNGLASNCGGDKDAIAGFAQVFVKYLQ
jgi:hypothetical protein